MGMYCVIVSILLMECVVFHGSMRRVYLKKYSYAITVVFLALVAGMRSLTVGHDTSNYCNIYHQIRELSFASVLQENRYSDMEQGYVWLCWMFGKVTKNFSWFLVATSLFEFSAVGSWIWKNTRKPFLGLLVFVCMFYTFFLTGIRQCIAFSILLFSYEDVKNRNITGVCIKIVLACLFHQSAAVFAIVYFMPSIFPNCRNTFWLTMIMTPTLFLIRKRLYSFVVGLFEKYSDYQMLNHGDAVTYTLMLTLLVVIAVFMLYASPIRENVEKKEYCLYTNCIMVALLSMPFVGLNGSIMRAAMYFSIFICLLLEKIYARFRNAKSRLLVELFSIPVLVLLFFNELSGSSYLYEFVGFENLF